MALKKFCVNITRTITLEQTVTVQARNQQEAMDKVQSHYDGGKGGDAYVTFKNEKGFAKDAEGDDISDNVEVNDAWLDN